MVNISVSALSIYPVKSLAGIALGSSRVEDFGLRHDRRWMLVDTNRKFISQRDQARMCLISTQLTEDSLQLSAAGLDPLSIDM
ncbi:MAG: MOSC N-terminal beta barrel domain-containing protein, partial [Thiohalomonadales bacterium]